MAAMRGANSKEAAITQKQRVIRGKVSPNG